MFLGKNGSTLAENFVPKALVNAATAAVDSLKINSISEKTRRGRRVVVKCRNLAGEKMADLANLYFFVTGIPIRFWSKVDNWRRWEIMCFKMLNGDRFHAVASGKRTVIEDKLPGKSIWDHMQEGTLNQRMLRAAANELRRAHQFWTDEFNGPWSHGDASTPNVIYNEKTDRARLIDFEIVHEKSLTARQRQADDLVVFLLDMVGLVSSQQWLPFALCFLRHYGEAAVIAQVKEQLCLPSGLAWIWWGVRTNFTDKAKVKSRLAKLRKAIPTLKIYAASRARQSRRPSISCQVTRPGMPRANSRTRAMRDKAKAASPGMPRRAPTIR